MTFETTLYVNKSILSQIHSAMEITNFRKTSLIVLLLKYVMNDYSILEKQQSTIKYQSNACLKKWKRVHVRFTDDEYVFCIDMRRFFRMSVSGLLAYSVRRYLGIIIEKILRKKISGEDIHDNYLFSKYKFKRKVQDNTIFWEQSWRKKRKRKKK